MEVHFVPQKTSHQTPYLIGVQSVGYKVFQVQLSVFLYRMPASYLKLVQYSVAEEEEAHGADEAEASGEGDQEVGEKPVLGYHGDTGDPGTNVILRVHCIDSWYKTAQPGCL